MGIYGLTGGIGSGKSQAAKRFAAHGIPTIDADRIGHDVIEPGGAAYEEVVAAFGDGILEDGRVDRDRLGSIVFRDEAARERLNGIVHPRIQQVIAERVSEYMEEGIEDVIVDAALLGEGGEPDPWLAGLILVLCPEDVRVQRLKERRGMDEAEARRRIASQTLPESKRPIADWVIENSGTIEGLNEQVDTIAQVIRANGT